MTFLFPVRGVALLCVALALITQSARAQASAPDRGLNLTPQQMVEIDRLNRAEHESFLAIVRDPALTDDQRLAKAARVHRTFAAAVEALMSPSQLAKARLPVEPVRAWPWPTAIASERLPDAQRSQLDALAREAIQARNEIAANPGLSNVQKWAAVEAHERAIWGRFRALLTPAQRALLSPAVRIEIGRPLLAVNP